MIYAHIAVLIIIIIAGIYLKKRIATTDRESEGSILDMDCGGVMNGVYYTRPLMKLMIFEDRIFVKALFSTILINKGNIISVKPQSGFLAKGLLLKYRESQTQKEKEIIVWTDFVSGEKHKEVLNLIVEKFTQSLT